MNLLLNLASSLLLTSGAAGHDPCGGSAYTAFSCNVGDETIAVCKDAAGDRLTDFHYGPVGIIDVSARPVSESGHGGVHTGELLFAAGEVRYLRFGGHKTEYVVYSGEGRGWIQSGLVILMSGNAQKNVECTGPAVFALDGLKDLPRDSDARARSIWWQVPISGK